MKPLASTLTNRESFEIELKNNLIENHAIGFILDSKSGSLKRSGLITQADCVLPLDRLLGSQATLFYLDPRGLSGEGYSNAVDEFENSLMSSGIVKFELETPCIILMRHSQNHFSNLSVISLNEKTSCMWHSQVSEFISQYLGSQASNPIPNGGHWLNRLIKTHSGTIGIDALKVSISQLITQSFQSLS